MGKGCKGALVAVPMHLGCRVTWSAPKGESVSDRRAHILYAVIGIGLAIALAAVLDAPISFSLAVGLWLEVLVLLVIAAFIFEPQFSGGGQAAANSIAAVLIVIGADYRTHEAWWRALGVAAVLSLVLNVVAYAFRDPSRDRFARPNRVARVAGQAGVALGGWRSLLSAAVVLSLATFNRPFSSAWTVGSVVLIYTFGLARLQPHRLLAQLQNGLPGAAPVVVAAIFPPSEILLVGEGADELDRGSWVRIASIRGSADGIVTIRAQHGGAAGWRALVPDLIAALPGDSSNQLHEVLEVQLLTECPPGLEHVTAEVGDPDVQVAGVLGEGSAMLEAVIELRPGSQVSLGEVIWTASVDGRTFWQVSDASVNRVAWAGDTRRNVSARAAQIGRWEHDLPGFIPDIRSPEPTGLAFSGALLSPQQPNLQPHQLRVGLLPGSPYPVVVDLAALSRHHAAILGITGTGKSHLAFALIEGLRAIGTKVVCVDLTGQYAVRFPDAVTVATIEELDAFVSGEGTMAIVVLGDGSPITKVNRVARRLQGWASELPPPEPEAPARCVLVLEEAQNFVPEAFVVNDWDLKAKAQDTSLVVMESRKFGLGFMLISQRTAMVTKSALSQCNTIFAFRAVDQTGLDYLEGICGSALARGLPTLPIRTALVMGRGSISTAPLIACLDEAAVVVH